MIPDPMNAPLNSGPMRSLCLTFGLALLLHGGCMAKTHDTNRLDRIISVGESRSEAETALRSRNVGKVQLQLDEGLAIARLGVLILNHLK